MMQEINCSNRVDDKNNPTGGHVSGEGIDIRWQDGPRGTSPKNKAANGAFVEGVIQAAIQRLQFFQETKFECVENSNAIQGLTIALKALNSRTALRQERMVEGQNKI